MGQLPFRRDAMKVALTLLLFVVPALALAQRAAVASACGPENVRFKVKRDDSTRTSVQAEAGKSRVYFVSDAGTSATVGYPTTKLGIDGTWVGANHGNSYFYASIEPGDHHLCAALQSSLVAGRFELAHFAAEPDKVYFYRTRLVLSRAMELLVLEQVDSDEGKYLIATFPLSVSSTKR
jgi:hypothetical protein